MGAPTRYIGCHPFAYTDDKIGVQDKAVFVEILIIQSTVCTFSKLYGKMYQIGNSQKKIPLIQI